MLWAAPNKGLSPHSTMIRREQGEVEPISPAGPLGQSIVSARLAAKLLGVTVGLGVGGEAGSFAGVLAGDGLYFTPDGKIGTYGSLGGEMGVLFSASATLQFAMTKGGLE